MPLLPVINGYQFENNDLAHLAMAVQGGGGAAGPVKGAFFTETIVYGRAAYDFSSLSGKRILGFGFYDASPNEQAVPPNDELEDILCDVAFRAERILLRGIFNGDAIMIALSIPTRFNSPTMIVIKKPGAISTTMYVAYAD